MNRLGTRTNTKKKWVEIMDEEDLAPGTVIMAEPGSFDHYFLESLVLILEHDEDDAKGTKGVLLNHETPWTVDEMTPGALGPFAANPLFLGGDAGKDTMLMVHGEFELPGAKEVGRGVYIGGVANAMRAVEEGALPPDRFKFFFKTVEWLPGQLSEQVEAGLFKVIDLSPFWLLGQNGERAMWKEVRDALPYSEDPKKDAEVTGAMAPTSEDKGLPYEKRSLDQEASRAADKMRKGIEEHRQKRSVHDEKLKEYVASLKKEIAEKEGSSATKEVVAEPPPMVRDEAAAAAAWTPPEAVAEAAPPKPKAEDEAAEAMAWLKERGIVAPAAKAASEETVTSTSSSESSAAGIVEVLEHRVFMKKEQWRVKWQTGEESWEIMSVLDTDELRRRAEELR